MNNICLDSIGDIVRFVGPEDVGTLRLISRKWNRAVEGIFKSLASRIEDCDLVDRVCARISLQLPEKLSMGSLLIRIFRGMYTDVCRKTYEIRALRMAFDGCQLNRHILSIEDLRKVEEGVTLIESEAISILEEKLPNRAPLIREGGSFCEICNRILQQPHLTPEEIRTVISMALRLDAAQIIKTVIDTQQIDRLSSQDIDLIAKTLQSVSYSCCQILADSPQGTRAKEMFNRILWYAAKFCRVRDLKALMQIDPLKDNFSKYLFRLVLSAVKLNDPESLSTVLKMEGLDEIESKFLALTLWNASFIHREQCMQLLVDSQVFARIPCADLKRIFRKVVRSGSFSLAHILENSTRYHEIASGNRMKDVVIPYCLGRRGLDDEIFAIQDVLLGSGLTVLGAFLRNGYSKNQLVGIGILASGVALLSGSLLQLARIEWSRAREGEDISWVLSSARLLNMEDVVIV